jgi:hypothetical protein
MPSFETPQPITVSLELDLGRVHFIAGDRPDTVVVVHAADASRPLDVEAAANTRVEMSAGTLFIKSSGPRGFGSFLGLGRYGSVHVTIELPEASRVEATGGMIDFRSDGRLGETHIKDGAGEVVLDVTGRAVISSGAGRVEVDRVAGNAKITTAGDMRIGTVDGDAEIKNQSGRTRIREVKGELLVRSSNGDITVDRAPVGLTAKTANGSIEVGEVATGRVVLETSAGGIDVGIREGSAAWIDATTRFGKVHNSMGHSAAPASGEASVDVRARTSFGDITIHRARLDNQESQR